MQRERRGLIYGLGEAALQHVAEQVDHGVELVEDLHAAHGLGPDNGHDDDDDDADAQASPHVGADA